ncbi:hypothetical protein Patl1_10329 [Pistacia atlantica]|uniref:Uncharacterized protein n=1 Tax=Pistacia atlantica TaxID=434234 RepID=A0ACC1A6M3_9ROSI|nr:hypothetical protein Patl1_10329 [Pistacia atlantica]
MLKLYWVVFVLVVVVAASNMNIFGVGGAEPLVPCYFIFGDSLVDSGNNNNLATHAKADYTPFGIDFPHGPTGRFTNAEKLGFPHFIPSFATANGSEILRGVNYASGSAGIRDETGKQLGDRINLKKQLKHHKITVSRIARILGSNESANQHLQKCLYSVEMGSNDYINNYFLPKFYNTSKLYNPKQYATVLADQFSRKLTSLYKRGARKVTVAGLGLIGCTPNAKSLYETKGLCVEKMNSATNLFNEKLKLLVLKLNSQLKNATFIFINNRKIAAVSALSPAMKNIDSSGECCEVGSHGLCKPSSTPCKERNAVVFWDSFHPTEIVNKHQAEITFSNSDTNVTFPMDIQRLVRL